MHSCSHHRNEQSVLSKLKLDLLCDPAISLLGVDPKDSKSTHPRDTPTPVFVKSLFVRAKFTEPTWVSPSRGTARENVVYVHNRV